MAFRDFGRFCRVDGLSFRQLSRCWVWVSRWDFSSDKDARCDPFDKVRGVEIRFSDSSVAAPVNVMHPGHPQPRAEPEPLEGTCASGWRVLMAS